MFRPFGKDPTAEWPPVGANGLRFDLATGEINGVPAGASFEALQAIGRPANRDPVHHGEFVYPGLGVAFFAKPELSNADFDFRAEDVFGQPGSSAGAPEFAPCRLTFRRSDGAETEVTGATSRSDLERFFGAPTSAETSEDFAVLAYVTGPWRLEFEFSPAGELHTLRIEPPE